jgi:zinc/manganese transport system substrate-binding protein
MLKPVALALAAVLLAAPAARAAPVTVVAAESVYGDVARQIGGTGVSVSSILANPDQDPHLFEPSPSVARQVSGARIVIYNGLGYDAWLQKLLGAARSDHRTAIGVADLAGARPGANPHIWYSTAAMRALARSLCVALILADPPHRGEYLQRLTRFDASLNPLDARMTALRRRFAGAPVAATEPILGYLIDAIGLRAVNPAFQLAVMNNTEPSAASIVALETALKTRKVRLLIYNSQATDPIADRMRGLARAAHVPVVAATETEPAGASYQAWMANELGALERALSGSPG